MRPWQVGELENLIAWIRENRERLRGTGKPADWIDGIGVDVFPGNEGFEQITVEELGDKYSTAA